MFINVSDKQKAEQSVIKQTTTIEEIVKFLDQVSRIQVNVDVLARQPRA